MKNIGRFRHVGTRVIGVRTHDVCGCKFDAFTKKPTTDAHCQCAACINRRKTRDRRKPIASIADINEANRRAFARKEKP